MISRKRAAPLVASLTVILLGTFMLVGGDAAFIRWLGGVVLAAGAGLVIIYLRADRASK